MDETISCRKLNKAYGYVPALRELDFAAARGEIVALIGDNGAGKSTLLKVLATLLRPDSGECRVLGHDLASDAQKARARIGYLGHESMLDRVLTLRENLQLFASLYGAPASRGEELISRLGASAYADNAIAELSRGQEQAGALGRALVHRPDVLLLDEPFNALDPEARKRLGALLKEEAARGATVLFSTHDVDGAAGVASRVAKMAAGKIV
ncbi:putative multidrug ABC transporter ATP-binding protein YbhF [Planctomycetaceae bacterium]|nr:putative multidrug ABC transporter ATP-binding protein YbhF [Planctomycetaceae bacterium]